MSKLLTHEQVRWAHEQWCAGYTMQEISEALYVCSKTLQRAFAKRGMSRRRPPLTAPDWTKVKAAGSADTETGGTK